jgi:hypothetical protein
MNPPLWLLDIDGVINANKPGWSAAPQRVHCGGFLIRWAPALISRIRTLHHAGHDIRWASSWCGYPDDLAALTDRLGLSLDPAFGDRPPSKTWGDLKADAALAALAEGRPLIWTDDDEVDPARTMFPELAAAEQDGRALLIAPRSNRGLQPADLDRIEAFLSRVSVE